MATEEEELAQTVAAWLNYKSLVGLKGQLSESMLTVPIAEYLASKHGREISMEVPHPLFRTGARGRPKQIDFVREVRGDKSQGDGAKDERNWKLAMECKYQSDTAQRLVDDICRLAVLAQCRKQVGGPKRLFLFAGERNEKRQRLDVRINSGGENGRVSVFEGVLRRFDDGDSWKKLTVDLRSLSKGQKRLFRNFCTEYGASMPSKLSTEMVGFGKSGRFSCTIWQVLSVSGTRLLTDADWDF